MLLAALDDNVYTSLLSVHVLAAIIWVGGGAAITILAQRAMSANTESEFAKILETAEWMGTRIFIPTSMVLLLCGFGMIGVGHLGFGHLWIDLALAGWFISFLVGSAFLGPNSKKLSLAVTGEGGSWTEPHIARLKTIVLVARIDLIILFLVVVNMVVKPGGS